MPPPARPDDRRMRTGSPAAARRRALPDRRRDRDRPDLPRGSRPAGVRRVRPAQGRRRAPTRCAATTRPTPRSPPSAGVGFIAESPTWRASPRWAAELGYARRADAFNRRAIALMEELRARRARAPVVISGCIGPRDDGYNPAQLLSRRGGRGLPRDPDRDLRRHRRRHGHGDHDDLRRGGDRHHPRRGRARPAGRDLVHGRDRRPAPERADAWRRDRSRSTTPTGAAPAYYMINCAHPTHFEDVLEAPWVERIRGLRANASTLQPRRARRGHRARRRRSARSRPPATRRSARSRGSTCSAAAAAPTTGTSRRSPARLV